MSKHSPNPEIIRNMFSKVAANYDKGNTVLSMGVHHLWRKKLVKYSGAKFGDKNFRLRNWYWGFSDRV